MNVYIVHYLLSQLIDFKIQCKTCTTQVDNETVCVVLHGNKHTLQIVHVDAVMPLLLHYITATSPVSLLTLFCISPTVCGHAAV